MEYVINTARDALEALNYFNGFHDGFIKKLTIASHDEFKNKDEQICTGELGLAIVFAHYNYQNGERPYNQMIEATFNGVKDLMISFSGNSYEWSVNDLVISETRRMGEDGKDELCLRALIAQPRLENGREWVLHNDLSFTFRSCLLREVGAV